MVVSGGGPHGSGDRHPETPEEEVPAPVWAKLVLVAAPFVVAVLVYLLVRNLGG